MAGTYKFPIGKYPGGLQQLNWIITWEHANRTAERLVDDTDKKSLEAEVEPHSFGMHK